MNIKIVLSIIVVVILFSSLSCSSKENNEITFSEYSDSVSIIESKGDYIKDIEINRIGRVGLTTGLNEVVINGDIHLIIYVGEYSSTMVRIK